MNDLIKQLQDVIEKKAENHELKQELSSLLKMLKTGFEGKNLGADKVSKVFASNDNATIKKFYDTFGNQLNALQVTGNFDKFAEYLSIQFGIKIEFTDSAPHIQYIKKGKKLTKFQDLYTQYFLEDPPREAKEAVKKILGSVDALTKEYNKENDEVKEQIKEIIHSQSEHSPTTVKVVDKILTSARIKALDPEDIADNVENVLSLQLQGIELIKKDVSAE